MTKPSTNKLIPPSIILFIIIYPTGAEKEDRTKVEEKKKEEMKEVSSLNYWIHFKLDRRKKEKNKREKRMIEFSGSIFD